jgi:hypothetical protein
MNPVRMRAALAAPLVAALVAGTTAARAHGTHDDAPPRAAGTPAAPRLVAESETFELVGVLERGDTLRLWLDRWADNAPVPDARIELEIGSTKVVAAPAKDAPGYVATLPAPLPDGVVAVTAAIVAGTLADLLVGELDVHGAAATAPGGHAAAGSGVVARIADAPRSLLAAVAAAGLAAIAGAALFVRARRTRRSLP